MEDTHKNIVHYRKDCAAEIVAEIGNGLGQYFCRCSHPPQNGGCQRNTGSSQHDTGNQTKGNRCVDGFAHGVVLLGTVCTGDDYAGSHGNTVEKADHHKDQTSGGTDGSQGIVADEITNAPGVEGIVELLKYIAEKYRQGEKQHGLPNRPLGQGIAFRLQNLPLL